MSVSWEEKIKKFMTKLQKKYKNLVVSMQTNIEIDNDAPNNKWQS